MPGRLLSVVQDTRFGPRENRLCNVNQIRPVYLIRDEDGTVQMTSSEEKEDILKRDASLSLKVGWERVPAGNYLAGVRIDILSGESTRDCMKIKEK